MKKLLPLTIAIAAAAMLVGCVTDGPDPLPPASNSAPTPSESPRLDPESQRQYDACILDYSGGMLPARARYTLQELCTGLASISLAGLREDLGFGEEFGYTTSINFATGTVELAVPPKFVEATSEWVEQFQGAVVVVPGPAETLL